MGVEESFILRECNKLQVSQPKAHSKLVGCKYEVNEKFMILHSEKLHDLHNLPSVIRRVKSRKLGSASSWGAED
jgi:hypothetical protein